MRHVSPSRHHTFALLGVVAATLTTVAALNAVVDPFQQYRQPSSQNVRFYAAFQRFQNPGLARHYNYDRVVIGSSLFENVVPGEVDSLMGGRTLNLALSAMSSHDLHTLLRHVLAQGKAKHVIIGIDYAAFTGASDRPGFGALPYYLYDDHVLNDAPYLLSGGTTFKSIEILADARINRFRTDPAKPWWWADDVKFGKHLTVAGLRPDQLNVQFKQPSYPPAETIRNLQANLLPLLQAHPSVRFTLIFPPYSALVWADFQQRAQVDNVLAFKRALITSVAMLANVDTFDFQGEQRVIENLEEYKDIYHFSPTVTRWILRSIAQNSYRLNAANLEQQLTQQRAYAQSLNVQALLTD